MCYFLFGLVNALNTDETPGNFTLGLNAKNDYRGDYSVALCVFGPLQRPIFLFQRYCLCFHKYAILSYFTLQEITGKG